MMPPAYLLEQAAARLHGLPSHRDTTMNIDLSGNTALVTGPTAGIGLAIAKGLAATGADVVVNGRGQDKVDAAVKAIKASKPAGKISGIAADVSTEAGCNAVVAALPDVDILVNNTGIF